MIQQSVVGGERRYHHQVLVNPDRQVDAQRKHAHRQQRSVNDGEDQRDKGHEETAGDHGPVERRVMPIHLAKQGVGFPGKIAEPHDEELCPQKIQPQQHEAADHHAQRADLVHSEQRLLGRESTQHHWNCQQRRRARIDITEPIVNGKHGAMPVRNQHHGEIPGQKRIADNESSKHERR